MADEQPALPLPEFAMEAGQRSLGDDLRHLASEARSYAEAEAAFQKQRAAFIGSEAQRIAVLGIVAVVLSWFAVLAIVVGAILILLPHVGALSATAIVGGILVLLAVITGLLTLSRFKQAKRLVTQGSDGGQS